MKWFSFVSLVILGACSQTPKSEKKFEAVRISASAIEECKEYKKNTLDQAYTFQINNTVQFTRNYNLARTAIGSFDVEKGLSKQRAQMVQNILHSCDKEKIKVFNRDYKRVGECSLMVSELNYFQGLAVAIKKYPWPTQLQLESKKQALDYVRYFSEEYYPLLNRLVALSVLDELSVNQIVSQDLHQEIKILMQDSQNYVEGLKMKLNKDPTLSCESLDVIRDELLYSEVLGKQIKSLLGRI